MSWKLVLYVILPSSHPRIKYAWTYTQYYITRRWEGGDLCARVKSPRRYLLHGVADDSTEEVKQMHKLIIQQRDYANIWDSQGGRGGNDRNGNRAAVWFVDGRTKGLKAWRAARSGGGDRRLADWVVDGVGLFGGETRGHGGSPHTQAHAFAKFLRSRRRHPPSRPNPGDVDAQYISTRYGRQSRVSRRNFCLFFFSFFYFGIAILFFLRPARANSRTTRWTGRACLNTPTVYRIVQQRRHDR